MTTGRLTEHGDVVGIATKACDVVMNPAQRSGLVLQAAIGRAVFVGPQVRGGFADIDRGIRDSIRDLKEELQFAGFRVASKPEDAAQSSLMNSDAAVGGEIEPRLLSRRGRT